MPGTALQCRAGLQRRRFRVRINPNKRKGRSHRVDDQGQGPRLPTISGEGVGDPWGAWERGGRDDVVAQNGALVRC